jgi:hypothetical protein
MQVFFLRDPRRTAPRRGTARYRFIGYIIQPNFRKRKHSKWRGNQILYGIVRIRQGKNHEAQLSSQSYAVVGKIQVTHANDTYSENISERTEKAVAAWRAKVRCGGDFVCVEALTSALRKSQPVSQIIRLIL